MFDDEDDEHVISIALYNNFNKDSTPKSFSVQLSLLSGVRTRLTPSAMTVTIVDDEPLPRKYA